MSIATRSLAAVSVGAVAFFTGLAARTQAGHAKTARAGSGSGSTVAPTPTTQLTPPQQLPDPSQFQDPSSGNSQTLSPPPTQPAPGYQYDPAPVVSGAT